MAERADVDEIVGMLTGNLEKIAEHGRRADGIVKSMLEHSRGVSGERREVDLNALVEEALNLAYHGARAQDAGFNITLEREFDPAVAPIELAPQEMTRVFLNLFGNGFYAATKRGRARSSAVCGAECRAGHGGGPTLRAVRFEELGPLVPALDLAQFARRGVRYRRARNQPLLSRSASAPWPHAGVQRVSAAVDRTVGRGARGARRRARPSLGCHQAEAADQHCCHARASPDLAGSPS